MSRSDLRRDRKLLAWLLVSVVLLIIVISLLTPRRNDQDRRPTTWNTGSRGAKVLFLTLQEMGRTAVRWDKPSSHISQLDPAKITLVLAEPNVATQDRDHVAARLKDFMQRGGHVLLAGSGRAATLLPGGKTEDPGELAPEFCDTTPEGPGPLAAVGSAQMEFAGSWSASGPQFRIEQRCGGKPVVVRFPVGAGEAVWWSSATPLTNSGLKRDANLKLLLASLGEGRDVYFDEYYFGQHTPVVPLGNDSRVLWAMFWQFCLLFVLLVWSFSRRKGPLRMPVAVPRSSPVEFAQSMGGLYGKAQATGPVVEASQRRLERVLMSEAGISRETIHSGPESVAEALTARFGGEWSALRRHLEEAIAARSAVMSPGDALALVRAMADDEERLHALLAPKAHAALQSVEEPVNA